MNKDGTGGFHDAAVGAAKLYCHDFLLRIENEVKKAHPKNAQAWIGYLKGKTSVK